MERRGSFKFQLDDNIIVRVARFFFMLNKAFRGCESQQSFVALQFSRQRGTFLKKNFGPFFRSSLQF